MKFHLCTPTEITIQQRSRSEALAVPHGGSRTQRTARDPYFADPKREISEKKWVEAQPRAGGRSQCQQEFQAAE